MMQNLTLTERPYHRILAVVLVFFSFAMGALISRAVFDHMPHLEDEMAYLFQARIVAGGHLVIDSPEPRQAYWQPFVVDYAGNRFGKYTLGWPVQLAVGVLMGQMWVINAFFAAMTVALVYRLGREVYSSDVGVFAAALTAFSPMALLLEGTLMGHTSALFALMLFVYAYWRMEKPRHRLRWGLVAGIALGLLVTNRPLTGLAVAIPFVTWSGVRLLRALLADLRARSPQPNPPADAHRDALPDAATQPALPARRSFATTLAPLLALGAITAVMSLSIPLFNYLATGDPSKNLYTLVWSYDRVGFGEGYGQHGHTLEKGVRQMRFDLSLMAADLFGWQLEGRFVPTPTPMPSGGSRWEVSPMTTASGALNPEVQDHLLTQGDYYPLFGISWVLLPFGLIVAFRRKSVALAIWLAVGLAWLLFPFLTGDINTIRTPYIAWIIIFGLLAWLVAPLLVLRDRTRVWTWLLASIALALITLQMAYWIGSQRYSTRYYFEGLPALALISALPLAWLANRRIRGIRPAVYVALAAALLYSLYAYSMPRISVLHGFNLMGQELVREVEARRDGDRPVLVLVTGDSVRWRSYGPLMAVTSPYLDSPIVAARASSTISRDDILARFPDRQIIEMDALENQAWFAEERPPLIGSVG